MRVRGVGWSIFVGLVVTVLGQLCAFSLSTSAIIGGIVTVIILIAGIERDG